MPALSDYVTGTISLTNGDVDFTGTSTGWLLAGFKEGDTIIDITGATEYWGVIATIDANGAGTLTKAWEGPTLVNVAYRMRYQPDGARVSAQARNLIELLGNGNVLALAGLSGSANQVPMFTGPGAMTLVPKTDLVTGVAYDVQVDLLADRAAYDGQAEGFTVLVADVGDGRAAVYSKASATSGDWTDPAYVTGPVGPAPVFTVDDTTTLAPGSAATFTLTPTVDGYEIDIGIPAGRADGVPFLWDTGTTDADPGAGDIRANNAALGSATFLYVSKTSAAGSAIAAYLLALDDSTNPTKKGDLILKRTADGVSASFIVGTVTDATNYAKVAVSGHAGAASFVAADPIQFEFARAGDKGADGLGTGDVVGPASAVADRIAVFDGITGKLLKDGGKTIAEIAPAIAQGRLTLTSGVPVADADVSGVTTIYYTPSGGRNVPVYDGSEFVARSIGTQISLALDATSGHTNYHQADKVFDLFAIMDGGTLKLATGPSWDAGAVAGSNFARGTGAGSTELEVHNGLLVNKNEMVSRFGAGSGDTVSISARQATYLGSFAPTAAGQASDNKQRRRLFNAFNREIRPLLVSDPAGNWNYSVATWRISNANANNYVEVLNGLAGVMVQLTVRAIVGASATVVVHAGLGVNSTTAVPDELLIDAASTVAGNLQSMSEEYRANPGLGLNKFNWLELGSAGATVTWYGTVAGTYRAGMSGSVCI